MLENVIGDIFERANAGSSKKGEVMSKRIVVLVMVLMTGCAWAEEVTIEPVVEAASNPWMPVIGELTSLALQILGPVLAVLASAVVWKLLGKLGIDKNAAMDALIRTYVKQGINYADGWASKQSSKPLGDQKMTVAVKHILDLVANSKLPQMAEEKLVALVESQLAFDKKNIDLPGEVFKADGVING